MIKIGRRIIAVPERKQYVDRLLNRIGADESIVCVYNDHNGCMWNAIRAWEQYATEPDATHWCVMADDTDVVDDYIELERMCVERFPDAIWTFYSNELSMKHKPEKTPYVKLSSLNVRGIAFLMPTSWVDEYVQWCKRMLADYGYQRDDATCRIYALMNNLTVMTTIPNLVRSYEIKSAMSGHGITHNSDAWQGYALDKREFLTDTFEVRHIAQKSARETHLKADNPVDILVDKKWKRLQLLRKV